MTTTHADIADGQRIDIEVTLVTRRPFQTEHGKVHRLLVEDHADATFPVLVAAGVDSLHDLKTGATYQINGLLGAVPAGDADEAEHDCPTCEGALRFGQQYDGVGRAVTEAATMLADDAAFGVVDSTTTVQTVRNDPTAVNDWIPMRGTERLDPPAYVCTDCHRHISRAEVVDADSHHPSEHEDMERTLHSNVMESPAASETVGLAAGGAKDVTNFRENVAEGFTPKPGAITDEGLFYDYYFETGDAPDSDALFTPRYAAAKSTHPISGEPETYLSVGLDSSLSVDDFERPQLELVVVLDVSGSMTSSFREYYYDEHGRRRETDADETRKIDAATQSVCSLTEQLRPSDRLGIVLFNSRAHVAKPLRDIDATDMQAIRRHVRNVEAGGGTNLVDGFDAAVAMFGDNPAGPNVERRVVFTTDMMPNTGTTDGIELERRFSDAAVDGIHTTFVGMGLDENADLVESLSGIRGANHYFVNSADEFERRLGAEFDYMVTPLVYDLTLELDADGYEIDAVHGSPSSHAETGCLVHVGTLFPSAKQDGEARGGVILVRLRRTSPDPELDLVASWSERNGGAHTEGVTVDVPDEPEAFTHDGVRKAIALSRYASALRSWATSVHENGERNDGVDDWVAQERFGQHEKGSVPLTVPNRHAERFDQLRAYLEWELDALEDEDLRQEIELLDTLCRQSARAPEEVLD